VRVATYHRVSTTDQDPTTARAAERLGAELVLEIEETGSGAANDRPGLQRILDAARRSKLDVVLVWKLDRFGRSALDLLGHLRQLDTFGVRFVAVTQGLDVRPGGDPMSRLLLTMLSAVSEFERDLIRERTRAGLDRARRDGRRLGRPRVRRPDRTAVEDLRAQGATWAAVADALGCTVWAARQAGGAAKKGGTPGPRDRGATAVSDAPE
jgi:DNA invertase Pin-like site-specific DNA recombinase